MVYVYNSSYEYLGRAYKPRNYILKEFSEIRARLDQKLVVLEIGCGHGSCILPILKELPKAQGFACDFSRQAIEYLERSSMYEEVHARCQTFLHDATKDRLERHISPNSVDFVLLVFVFSAIPQNALKGVVCDIYKVCVCVRVCLLSSFKPH